MRRISPARDIQLDEAERAELLPVMDALRSLQMARRAERRPRGRPLDGPRLRRCRRLARAVFFRRRGCAPGCRSAAVVSGYRYRVHFEDGRDVTTNYVGKVLQVGDHITLEGRHWIITDAKVLRERDMDFEIHVRPAERE